MKPSLRYRLLSVLCSVAAIDLAAAQDGGVARSLAANCFTCHGTNGNSAGGVPPGLAGRDRIELFQTMKEFQLGKRPATVMHQQAKGYSDEQLELIVAYLATLKSEPAKLPSKARY